MGHELDGDVSAVDVALGFAARKSGGFIVFEAMPARNKACAKNRVVSLALAPDAVPLGHKPIYLDEQVIGQTTSCAFGYRLGKPVALAHVNVSLENGACVQVDIAREKFDAYVTNGPLFDPTGARMKT